MILIFGIILIIAAIAKAIMDTMRFGSTFRKYGDWWNPDQSWKMKWKNGDYKQGERFFGSSTVFVSLTDGWHFFQHWFLLTLFLAPVVYTQCYPIIAWKWWMVSDFALIYVFFTTVFQLIYWMLNRK